MLIISYQFLVSGLTSDTINFDFDLISFRFFEISFPIVSNRFFINDDIIILFSEIF